jgi:hypothetical protein
LKASLDQAGRDRKNQAIPPFKESLTGALKQFEKTPEAFANFSPGLELATTLGSLF